MGRLGHDQGRPQAAAHDDGNDDPPRTSTRRRDDLGRELQSGFREALERVRLTHRLGHRPTELSGGEQQRVALARALAPDPAILVADEPTGNLDEATGRQIVDLLFTKHAERGMTLVLVTHDTSLAQRCDRVVRLRSGRIDGHS
jgi:predicted ABC-type transport system involved in lysophospholipase L1 biosynthesis ATPase subunit